eukprot:202272-Hanusia_phi.AAC.4
MLVELERTARNLRELPAMRKGYADLAFFIIFFVLYVYVLVDKIYSIDEALRQTVVDESNSLQGINTHADFFS